MPYLIDGHNLIGSMPDINLDDPEDETRLIQMIDRFLFKVRKSATVYFDQHSPGSQRRFKSGRLQVEFSTSPHTADHAIQNRLRQLKGEARNYTVISSDHEVLQAAREAGAQVIESHTFVRHLVGPPITGDENGKPECSLTPEDIGYWQKMFGDPSKNDKNL